METTLLFRDLSQFYHHWAPLTWSIGFLEASSSVINDKILPWIESTRGQISPTIVNGSSEVLFRKLAPLTGLPTRIMLCTTRSNWIAYVDNGIRGSSVAAPIAYLSMLLGCRGVTAICIPHTHSASKKSRQGVYGSVQFELFGPEFRAGVGGNTVRSISSTRDAGKPWKFYESGIRLPFEEVDSYRQSNPRLCFTPDMLVKYCTKMGIALYDDEFYGPGGVIWDCMQIPQTVNWSLENAKQEVGIVL